MKLFSRTLAVLDKIVKDLQIVSFVLFVIVQIAFLVLYGFKIYYNIDDPFYFYLFIALAALSLFGFVFYVVAYNSRKKKVIRGTKRGVRIFKYLANGIMIIVLIVEFVYKNVSDLEVILSWVSIIGFMAQLFLEFIRIMYEKYEELMIIAFRKDTEFLDDLQNPKRVIYRKINVPLEKLSQKITGEVTPSDALSKNELYVESLAKEFQENHESKRSLKKEENKGVVKKERAAIKKNLKIIASNIFKRKRKSNDTSLTRID